MSIYLFTPAPVAPSGAKVKVFTDSGCTALATITSVEGLPIPGSVIPSDGQTGALPHFLGPQTSLWLKVQVTGGATVALTATDSGPAANPGGAYVPLTRTVAGKALSADVTLVKADVGLSNVDNTSDASKPVSTAQQTVLDAKVHVVEHGATAGTARSATATRVFWRGSVQPTNAVQYDRWINSGVTPYTESIYDGSAWTALGGGSSSSTVTITQQAADYTLVLADAGTEVEGTKATAQVVTVPPNSSVAFPTGTVLNVRQYGAGQITLTAGAGVTLRAPNGAKTAHQYSTASLVKRGTDEWIVGGDVTT